MARLLSVSPISGEDTNALPVKEIGPALAFYESVLRFSAISRDASTAVLTRDDVRIGLVRDPAHEPKKAGSMTLKLFTSNCKRTAAIPANSTSRNGTAGSTEPSS